MAQMLQRVRCNYCRRLTDECCDWCAFSGNSPNVATPLCTRHRYTRTPWNGEVHTLCPEHARQLHTIRQAWATDHGYTPVGLEWHGTQAHEYERYFERMAR